MPRLSGYRSTPPESAERKLEQLDAVFRPSTHARDKRTNDDRVNRRDFGFYFSSAKDIRHINESPRSDLPCTLLEIDKELPAAVDILFTRVLVIY